MKWIPTTQRLPTHSEQLLVIRQNNSAPNEGITQTITFETIEPNSDHWTKNIDGNLITHWCKPPIPPDPVDPNAPKTKPIKNHFLSKLKKINQLNLIMTLLIAGLISTLVNHNSILSHFQFFLFISLLITYPIHNFLRETLSRIHQETFKTPPVPSKYSTTTILLTGTTIGFLISYLFLKTIVQTQYNI